MEKKSNLWSKLLIVCLALVLVSSASVGIAFAKYFKSESAGSDTASVAKFGVSVTASADDLFDAAYAKDNALITQITGDTVANTEAGNLLAPGTTKSDAMTVAGTAQVAVKVDLTVEATATGWNIGEPATFYMPVSITVANGEDTLTIAQADYTEGVASKTFTLYFEANEAISEEITITWAWAFEGNDANDTALAQLAVAPTLAITSTAVITQID